MRKFLVSLALASAVIAVAPASAQPGFGFPGPGAGRIRADIDRLDFRIDRAERFGAISSREAFGLRRDLRDLRDLRFDYFRLSRNGLDFGEARFLTARVDRLQFRLRAERFDRDGFRG